MKIKIIPALLICIIFFSLSIVSTQDCFEDVCIDYVYELNNFRNYQNITISGNRTYNISYDSNLSISYLEGSDFTQQQFNLSETNLTFQTEANEVNNYTTLFNFSNTTSTFNISFENIYSNYEFYPEHNSQLDNFTSISWNITSILDSTDCEIFINDNLESSISSKEGEITFNGYNTEPEYNYHFECLDKNSDRYIFPEYTISLEKDTSKPKINLEYISGLSLYNTLFDNAYILYNSTTINEPSFFFAQNTQGTLLETNDLIITKDEDLEIIYYTDVFNFDINNFSSILVELKDNQICVYENLNLLRCEATTINPITSEIKLGPYEGSLSRFAYYENLDNYKEPFFENYTDSIYYSNFIKNNYSPKPQKFHSYNYTGTNQNQILIYGNDESHDSLNCSLSNNDNPINNYESFELTTHEYIDIDFQTTENKLQLTCQNDEGNQTTINKNISYSDNFQFDTQYNEKLETNMTYYADFNNNITSFIHFLIDNQQTHLNSKKNHNSDSVQIKNEHTYSGVKLNYLKFIDNYGNELEWYDQYPMEGIFDYTYAENVILNIPEINSVDFYSDESIEFSASPDNRLNESQEIKLNNSLDIRLGLNNDESDKILLLNLNDSKINYNSLIDINIDEISTDYFNNIGTRLESSISFNNSNSLTKDIQLNLNFTNLKFYDFSDTSIIAFSFTNYDEKRDLFYLENNDYQSVDESNLVSNFCELEVYENSGICYETGSRFLFSSQTIQNIFLTHDDYPPEMNIQNPESKAYSSPNLDIDISLNEESTCYWYTELDTEQNELGTGTEIHDEISFYPDDNDFYNFFFLCKDIHDNSNSESLSISINDTLPPEIDYTYDYSREDDGIEIDLDISVSKLSSCYLSTSDDPDDVFVERDSITDTSMTFTYNETNDYHLFCNDRLDNVGIEVLDIDIPEEDSEQDNEDDSSEENESESTNDDSKYRKEEYLYYNELIRFVPRESTNIQLGLNQFEVIRFNVDDPIYSNINILEVDLDRESFRIHYENFFDILKVSFSDEENGESISEIIIDFKLSESELNNLNQNNISLYESENGIHWEKIKTELYNIENIDDEDVFHYRSVYDGLSKYFLIAEGKSVNTIDDDNNDDENPTNPNLADVEAGYLLDFFLEFLRNFFIVLAIATPLYGGFMYLTTKPNKTKTVVKKQTNNKQPKQKKIELKRKSKEEQKSLKEELKKQKEELEKLKKNQQEKSETENRYSKQNELSRKNINPDEFKTIPESLLPYIKEFEKNNVPKELVYQKLKDRGWKYSEIDRAYSRYYALKDLDIKSNFRKNHINQNTLENISKFLIPYVRAMFKKGYTINQIRSIFLDKGWSPEEIDYSILKARNI
ncbi:MAG: hypothetical protein ACOCRX_02070 [Candidatus Woesearchaeota archaeon]